MLQSGSARGQPDEAECRVDRVGQAGARLRTRPGDADSVHTARRGRRTWTRRPSTRSAASSTSRTVPPIPGDVFGDPSVDAVVIVTPTSTHRAMRGSRGGGGEGDLLREAAVHLAGRGDGTPAGGGAIRHVLSDGLHAPVRSRVRRRQAAARRRRHRRRGRVQVDVARSVPAVGRVRRSADQRRPDHRHGHPRLRPRPLVHGRRRGRPGGRRPARVSRARAASATSTTRSSA